MVIVTSVNSYEELAKQYFITAEKFREAFQLGDIETTMTLGEELTLIPQCHLITVEVETE